MLGVAIATAALAATPAPPVPAPAGRIAFASDRAEALIRPALYEVRRDGGGRRRLTPTLDFRGSSCPTWSPDGRRLAFVVDGYLEVVSAAGGAPRRVSRREFPCPATWSPDGTRLAYLSLHGEVRIVRDDGVGGRTFARRLGHVYGGVGWSPDGRRIAFPRATEFGQRLVLRDLRSGVETALPSTAEEDSEPAWSPDGRSIAFTYNNGLNAHDSIVVVDLADRARRTVGPYGHTPAWSPDGRLIGYAYYADLYVVGRDGRGNRRVVAGADELGDESPPSSITAEWSPDSRELATVIDGEVVAVRVDGKGRRKLTHERPGFRVIDYPAWSRSGPLVYASRKSDPGDRDIYTIAPNGSAIRAVTANGLDEDQPALSPDGRRVAFVRAAKGRQVDGGPTKIVVKNLPDGPERAIESNGSHPTWSPDGKRLAFGARDGIRILELGTGAARTLAASAEEGLDWSPDGKFLAASGGGEPYGAKLVLVPVGGDPAKDLVGAGCNRGADWSPDGALILFSAASECVDDDRGEALEAVTPTDSRLRPASPPLTDYVAENDPTWSPDGQWIAFSGTRYDRNDDRVSHLVVMRRDSSAPREVYSGPGSVWSPDWGR